MKAFKLVLCVLVVFIVSSCSNSLIQSAPVEEPSIEILIDSVSGFWQLDSLYKTGEDFAVNYVLKAEQYQFVRNPAFIWPEGISSNDAILFTYQGYVSDSSVSTVQTPSETLSLKWKYYYCYMGCPQMGDLPLRGGVSNQGYCFYLQKVGDPLYVYKNEQLAVCSYPYLANGTNMFGVVLGIRQIPSGFIVMLSSVGGHGGTSALGYSYIPRRGASVGFYQYKVHQPNYPDAYGRLHN